MQRVEAGAVGLQDRGESMLGDQKINEEVDPLTECRVRRATLRQQDRTSLGAGLDLMAVHGHHEIRSRREVAVYRPHSDASRRGDVTHRRLDTGRDEHGGGGGEQRLLVALRVGPHLSGWVPRSLVDGGHRFISSLTQELDKRNNVPYNSIGAVLHFISILWRKTIMQYRTLGRTGITVSQLCLGAMMFGAFGNPDHDESIRIIHNALDAGINFIDTADGYSAGESEEIVGKALAGGRRENVVLAVKFGPPFGEDPNHRGASRRWIMQGVEGSLRRLQTDWIDLYQVGVPDPNTDIDETLGALSDLVHAGKIRSFGASKVPASQIVEAQWTADRRGHERFRTEQPPYSLLTRAIEYDVLPTCLRHGMGVLTYSPLARGWLSGKYRKGQQVSGPGSAARAQRSGDFDSTNPANAAKLDAADALGALADEAGMTLIQMAVAFVTSHPAVTSAIIGPRTMEHLDAYLAADGIDLSSDVLDRIDQIVPPGVTINIADNMWNIRHAGAQCGIPPPPVDQPRPGQYHIMSESTESLRQMGHQRAHQQVGLGPG